MILKLLDIWEFQGESVISANQSDFLTLLTGKVIVINSALHGDIYFKPEHLLANTSGMALEKKKK